MAEESSSASTKQSGSKKVVVVGVDESKESFYSLEWTLDNLLCPAAGNKESPFKIILVHVKIPPLSVIRLSGPGMGDALTLIESDLKKTASTVIDQAKEICKKRSISDFEVEIVEGDSRTMLCEAVEKHHADVLVVGCHGYGALKRAFIGSVSDYCAHHAHCSVLIAKKPKAKK